MTVVGELRRRGVKFEEFDLPGLKTVNGIAEVAGNYPSKRSAGERTARFRDSEENLLGIVSRGAESSPSRSGPRGAPFSGSEPIRPGFSRRLVVSRAGVRPVSFDRGAAVSADAGDR